MESRSPAVKFEQALLKLTKELKARSLRVESAAERVMIWARKTEREVPDSYSKMRARELKLLRQAGKLAYKRSLRKLDLGKKSAPGTQRRLNYLRAHIYDVERWVFPILEKVSPETYKTALNQVLTSDIPEYSGWKDEFDKYDYAPEYILRLFGRAERLGIKPPMQIRLKCERALSNQPTIANMHDLLQRFVKGFWDIELAEVLMTKWSDRELSDQSFHEDLLFKVTTIPEARLKRYLRANFGMADDELRGPSSKLLQLAKDRGFFKNSAGDNEALPDLLQGYSKIRNNIHHPGTGGTRSFVETILLTNRVLNSIESQARALES